MRIRPQEPKGLLHGCAESGGGLSSFGPRKEGRSLDKIVRITGGLLAGFLVGYGLVILFTPRSGAETRYAIQERVDATLDAGRQAAEERRLELAAQLEDLKRPRPRQQL